MDRVTQQNAAMAEQSTAAAHVPSQETAALTQFTGWFRLGEEDGSVQAGAPAANLPTGRRPAAPLPGRGRVVLKVVSPPGCAGNAARKPAAMTKTDGWQEFCADGTPGCRPCPEQAGTAAGYLRARPRKPA